MYSKHKMPVSSKHIPTDDDIVQWKHLGGVPIPSIDSDVGLLIGNNMPDAFTPLELITGPKYKWRIVMFACMLAQHDFGRYTN